MGNPPRWPVQPQRSRPKPTRRICPPSDTVKLEDRLFYLLQPPLETWLHTENLQFPFEPFPFQLDGVAFLYPRHAAVLGDVMGLGKTMQAITTIRMLLRAGEIRSVLVICPKPLVTNWQREFDLWAPEIYNTLQDPKEANNIVHDANLWMMAPLLQELMP